MKEFLSQKGVPWVEKLVDQDRAAAIEMIRRSGQQGVPVTVIGDQVVVGFDRPRLERILATMQSAGATASNSASRSANGRRPLGARVANAGGYAMPGGTAAEGAYVGSVHTGSPAEAAGIKVGDVIVAVGDKPITSAGDLSRALGTVGPGAVRLTLARGATRRTVTVEL